METKNCERLSVKACSATFCLALQSTFLLLPFDSAIAGTIEAAQCVRDGVTRIVEHRVQGASSVPCQIIYSKPDEDQSSTVLWKASVDVSYCETQFDAFIDKLQTRLRWQCELQSSQDFISESTDLIEQPEDLAATTGAGTPLSGDVLIQPAAVVENEPVLQAAIAQPEVRKDTRRDQSFAVPNDLDAKTIVFEDIKRRLPSGWYAADSTLGHQGESSACPADGHFLWNTRHREQPIFEMGLALEFPVNINTANVLADEYGNLLLESTDMALKVGSANGSPSESTRTGNYDSASETNLPFVELLMMPSENEGTYQTACRFVYSGGF